MVAGMLRCACARLIAQTIFRPYKPVAGTGAITGGANQDNLMHTNQSEHESRADLSEARCKETTDIGRPSARCRSSLI